MVESLVCIHKLTLSHAEKDQRLAGPQHPLPVPLSAGIAGYTPPQLAERLTSGAFVINLPFQTEVLIWAPAEIGANAVSLMNLMSFSQNKSSSC